MGGYINIIKALKTKENLTGKKNVFLGNNAGHDNDSGSYNVFVGSNSGQYNLTGGSNAFIALVLYCEISHIRKRLLPL